MSKRQDSRSEQLAKLTRSLTSCAEDLPLLSRCVGWSQYTDAAAKQLFVKPRSRRLRSSAAQSGRHQNQLSFYRASTSFRAALHKRLPRENANLNAVIPRGPRHSHAHTSSRRSFPESLHHLAKANPIPRQHGPSSLRRLVRISHDPLAPGRRRLAPALRRLPDRPRPRPLPRHRGHQPPSLVPPRLDDHPPLRPIRPTLAPLRSIAPRHRHRSDGRHLAPLRLVSRTLGRLPLRPDPRPRRPRTGRSARPHRSRFIARRHSHRSYGEPATAAPGPPLSSASASAWRP